MTASGMQVGVAAARDRDRAELLLGRAELDHVPAHDRGEVDGLREPAERHLEVLLQRLRRVHLTRAAGHRPPLRRPRDREHVEHVVRLSRRAIACAARYGAVRGPRHAAAPRRGPQVVDGPEVLVERGDVEVGERARTT